MIPDTGSGDCLHRSVDAVAGDWLVSDWKGRADAVTLVRDVTNRPDLARWLPPMLDRPPIRIASLDLVGLCTFASTAKTQDGPPSTSAARSAAMRDLAQANTLVPAAAGTKSELISEPIYRRDDPARLFSDGTIWAFGKSGRPDALLCLSLLDDREVADLLFAFALGTDPEVFLMIESRPDPAGRFRWEYGLAPMTSFEVKAFWKGNQVWTLPWRKLSKDPTDPFYDMYYSEEPGADASYGKTCQVA